MLPEARDPEAGTPPPYVAVPNQQPGLIAGVCSIIAGAAGFAIPILGMVASCVGIWLGIKAIRQGRGGTYKPSVTCGIVGVSLAVLSIVYWVCVVLFESHR